MARINNTNYQGGAPGSDFQLATDDNDPYSREFDTYGPALALDGHDHTNGKGLPVGRLAANAVVEASILDGAVTSNKLAPLSVTNGKIAADAVDSTKLADDSVGAEHIIDNAVGTIALVDDAVTLGKLAHGTGNRIFGTDPTGVPALVQLAAAMVPNLLITGAMIADSTITGDQKIAPNTITGDSAGSAIPTNRIHVNRLASSSMTQSEVNRIFTAPAIDASTIVAVGSVTLSRCNIGGAAGSGKVVGHNGSDWTWVTPAAGVTMTGIVAAVAHAGVIPSGWSRESALDGRMMVFDGTTFSTTWVAQNNYGSTWGHLHNMAGHTHAGSGASSGGASAVTTNINLAFGGSEQVTPDHGHTISLSIVGDSNNVSSTSWVIPSRAYVPVIAS